MWLPISEVVTELTKQQLRLRRVIEEKLPDSMPGRGDRTVRYAILHGLHDEACHSGEIWLLRKLLRSR